MKAICVFVSHPAMPSLDGLSGDERLRLHRRSRIVFEACSIVSEGSRVNLLPVGSTIILPPGMAGFPDEFRDIGCPTTLFRDAQNLTICGCVVWRSVPSWVVVDVHFCGDHTDARDFVAV